MARPKRWTLEKMEDGAAEFTLSSWRYFGEFINQELLDYRTYVFRGHASEDWKLESTLSRALKKIPKDRRELARNNHLGNFKLAARGRRGRNPRDLPDEDAWWSLGQHHGLHTPLLDWTESPFVALYFAFNIVSTEGASHRAIWAVSEVAIKRIQQMGDEYSDARIIRPLTDENGRLVSQRGVFVRCPAGVALEEAVRKAHAGEGTQMVLIKFRIPNKERLVCLRNLNRMNINHLSLFPDLGGACDYSNTDLHVANY